MLDIYISLDMHTYESGYRKLYAWVAITWPDGTRSEKRLENLTAKQFEEFAKLAGGISKLEGV